MAMQASPGRAGYRPDPTKHPADRVVAGTRACIRG